MRMSSSTLVNIMLAIILIASLFLVNSTALSSQQEYDPWIDNNEDGAINILDAIRLAGVFGTQGNPAKNVTVTNWPVMRTPETTVWYANSSFALTSANYSASGFSYLHITLFVQYAGPGSSIDFRLKGIFRDIDSSQTRAFNAYLAVMTEDPRRDVLSVTIPVPSETFYFYATILSGGGTIFLSFYLTQA